MNPLNASASRIGRRPSGAMTRESFDVVGGGDRDTISTAADSEEMRDCATVFSLNGRSAESRMPRMVTRHRLTSLARVTGVSQGAAGPGLDIGLSGRGAGVARQPTTAKDNATSRQRTVDSSVRDCVNLLCLRRGS